MGQGWDSQTPVSWHADLQTAARHALRPTKKTSLRHVPSIPIFGPYRNTYCINFKHLCGRSSHVVYQEIALNLFQLKTQLLEQFQRLLMSLSYPSTNSWILKNLPFMHLSPTPSSIEKSPAFAEAAHPKSPHPFPATKNVALGRRLEDIGGDWHLCVFPWVR